MKLVREHINEISLGGSHLERMGVGMKASIKKWFDAAGVSPRNYKINDDLSIDVIGNLYLTGTPITSLPDNLSVKGSLDLRGTQITSLPDNLSVERSLDLRGTPITSLPDNLSVGGWLDLRGTPITSLPKDLKVKGKIYKDEIRFLRHIY